MVFLRELVRSTIVRVSAIVTKGLANDFLCLEISRQNELVAIFHPKQKRRTPKQKLETFLKWKQDYGAFYVALHKLSGSRLLGGWGGGLRQEQAEEVFFGGCHAEYERQLAPLAEYVDDVNGSEFVERLHEIKPDVVICSGGPIYRAPLIRACKIMVNYHAGISPLYNGSNTNWWAYANGHARLCGGTLMIMNEIVDGGDILAHYFTGIDPDDNPATLFCKAIRGGAKLYNEFLSDLKGNKPYSSVPQPRPFFYYRGIDWTLYQSLKVGNRLLLQKRRGLREPGHSAKYWTCDSDEIARRTFRDEILNRVLALE